MKMKNKSLGILLIILAVMVMGGKLFIKEDHTEKLDNRISQQYKINLQTSDKKLGSFVKDGKTFFRLFAPSAEKVVVVIFEQPEQTHGNEFEMIRDENSVWEATVDGELYGSFYGYRIKHTDNPAIEDIICLDPYAKAVTTFNTYFSPRRAIIMDQDGLERFNHLRNAYS